MKRSVLVLMCAALTAVFCGCNSEPVVFAEALQLKKGEKVYTNYNIWYTDPANRDEANEQISHMELVMALHKARKEAGLTQEQVAKRMGTSQTYIAAIERGRKNVSFSTIARFARACGKRVAITLL